jgi:predicted peroxiredoxin
MEKVVNRMINDAVEGVDTYKTKDSTWLIFTESKRWVIELTKDGTLWYNYNFFRDLLMYLSMDVVENQHYITKWVEDNIINKVEDTHGQITRNSTTVENIIINGVKETELHKGVRPLVVNNTIQNGVKETKRQLIPRNLKAKNVIENGVKHTIDTTHHKNKYVEDAIQNGVKETKSPGADGDLLSALDFMSDNNTNSVTRLIDDVIDNGVKYTGGIGNPNWMGNKVEKAIENGVKDTKLGAPNNRDYFIEDTIENGVKLTNGSLQIDGSCVIEDVIENGVKETCCHDMKLTKSVEKIIQKGIKNTYSDILPKEYDWSNQFDVQEVIDNGVKHTEYGDWEDGDERLDDIIQNGIKETLDDLHHRQREVVQTIKEGIKETIGEDYHHKNRIDGVIKNGVKETKSMDEWVNTYHIVNEVMNNGIKEVQPLPAQDGNRDWGKYYHGKEDITKPHTEYVNDVLDKGEKI